MSDNFSEISNDSTTSDYIVNVNTNKKNSFKNENLISGKNNSTSKNVFTKLDYYDKYFSNYIHEMEVNIWLERIIYIFARIFNSDLIIVFYILLFLYQYFINDKIFFVLKPLIHVFTVFILTGVLKYTIKRPRPEINERVRRRYNVRKKEKNFSMPSGDSMQAGNFAVVILLYFESYYGFIIVPFVMFARIFYFCHYLLDTIVGVFIGTSISLFMGYLLKLIKIQ